MSISLLLERITATGAPMAVDLGDAILHIPRDNEKTRFERAKTVIDATQSRTAAYYLDISNFPCREPEHAFLKEILSYAKDKGAYIIFDTKALSYSEEIKCLMETENICDGVTACPYLGEENIQPFVFAANKYKKSVFLYLNTEDETGFDAFSGMARRLSGQAFGAAQYSNLGVFLNNADDAEKVREKLPNCMLLTKVSKIDADLVKLFDDNGSGALPVISLLKHGKEFDFENLYIDARRAAERSARAINKTLFRKSTIIQI